MPEPDTYKFGNQEYKMSVRDKQEIPLDWGGKLVIYNCIVGGAIDARFIPAIVKGLMDRMEQGPLTGSAKLSATPTRKCSNRSTTSRCSFRPTSWAMS